MSEQTPTPPDPPDEQPPVEDDQQHDQQKPEPPKREATYRKRAVEAEARADALQTRLDTMLRSAVVALAEERGLAVGADLFDVGKADLADLLDSDGNVDASVVNDLADTLVSARPGLRRRTPRADQGMRGVQRKRENTTGWAELLAAGRDR
jgi:hypothetical protein